METQIPFFNPRHLSSDLLEKMLVGREALLQELQEDLIRQATSQSRQHWLIRGPRGFGKTHLAGLLYYRTKAHPGLSKKYLPIWLDETAAYRVYSAGTLLRVIADRLVEELRADNPTEAASLSETLQGITAPGDDPVLFEDLDELLRGIAGKAQKILLVLMENLDALLDSFAKPRSKVETKRLRSLLSHEKAYLFISTTPTHYLPKISHPRAPLYGQLKERVLSALSEEETERLLEKLIEVTGRANTLSSILNGREWKIRRRVLYRLTGGIPRAVVMAASMVSGIPGLTALVKEFRMLLDGLTPYFEGRLSTLAPRERVIVTAMALAPENLTIKAIALKTGLPERSLSTLVTRLEIEGYVIPSEGEGGKGTIYELREGLFRIWYQFRQANRMLPPLVRFLALWSSPEELDSNLINLRSETQPSSAFEIELLETTVIQLEEDLRYSRSDQGRMEREKLWTECREEVSTDKLEDMYYPLTQKPFSDSPSTSDPSRFMEAIKELSRLLSITDSRAQDRIVDLITSRNTLAIDSAKLGLYRASEEVFRDTINKFKDAEHPELQVQVARALFNLGVALGKQGQADEAVSIYRELIEKFKDSILPELQEAVARALSRLGEFIGRTGNIEEAKVLFQKWVSIMKRIDHPDAEHLDHPLQSMILVLPFEICRDYFKQLEAALKGEAKNSLQLFGYILSVLEISESSSLKKPSLGPGNRIRKALALIPPELRETVKEAVDSILKERQRITKQRIRSKRKV